MKNRFLLLCIICFSVFLLSCKKDHPTNDPSNNPAVDSVDEWEYITRNAPPSNDGAGVIAGSTSGGISVDSGVTWTYGTTTFNQPNDYGGLSVYGNFCTWVAQYPSDISYFYYVEEWSPYYYPSYRARLDTISSIPHLSQRLITGVYAYGVQSGYILTQEGNIYKVNGDFSPANISLDYHSRYFYDAGPNNTFAIFNKLEALDSNNIMAIGSPGPAGYPVLIHKRNGVYTEYNFANQFGGTGTVIRDMQYVDANTAYLLSEDGQLYKYSNDSNLIKLPLNVYISRFRFLNENVGYASVYINTSPYSIVFADSYIYKTVDGGITWTPDFILNSNEKITSFFVSGNEVWALGLDNFTSSSESGFILKMYKTIAAPSSPSPGGVITADIDGAPISFSNTTDFSNNVTAVQTYASGYYQIDITGVIPPVQAITGSDKILISIGGTVPITAGTYNDEWSSQPVYGGIGYVPVGTQLGYEYTGTGISPYIATVTITSIDSSHIQGTFSGTVLLQLGTATHVITNGRFSVPITH